MKSIKFRILIILISVIGLAVVIPVSASMATHLTKTPAQVTEEVVTYLPLIFKPSIFKKDQNPLIFVAGPIQGELDEEDIYMIKANGTELVNLTNSPSGYFDLAWSPDGSRFAFMKQSEGLFIMNADGSGLKHLADGGEPSWSPDSSMIVFIDLYSQATDKFSIINSDGSGLRELVSVNDGEIRAPKWSPNGNKIAYYWRDGLGHSDIFVVNSDGSGKTNLTNRRGGVDPLWSPDGSHILFGRSGEIYVMNADGTEQTNISNSPEFNYTFVWSPDGSKIAFDCNDSQICVMNPDGSGKTNVSGEISAYSWPAWAPDGSVLAFMEGSFASNYEIFAVTPSGTGKTFITNLPSQTWKSELIWQP